VAVVGAGAGRLPGDVAAVLERYTACTGDAESQYVAGWEGATWADGDAGAGGDAVVTAAGEAQMRALGGWLRRYVGVEGGLTWAAAGDGACSGSGAAFAAGWGEAVPPTSATPAASARQRTFASAAQADAVLAPARGVLYTGSGDGEAMQRAAFKVRSQLERVMAAVGTPVVAATGVPLHADDAPDEAVGGMLAAMPAVLAALQCERAWPATARASRQLVPPLARLEGSTSVPAAAHPVAPHADASLPPSRAGTPLCHVRHTLGDRLTANDEAFLRHAAWWVADQTFYTAPGAKGAAPARGGALLAEVVSALAAPASATTTAFIVPPESLHGLLAALRCRRGPAHALGPGALVVAEAWVDGTHAPTVRIWLVEDPFPATAGGDPACLHLDAATRVVDDVSLAALADLTARWRATPAPTAPKSYGSL